MVITVKDKGLVIDKDNPVLAAGVDSEVSDPTNKYHPIGHLEAKYKLVTLKLKERVDTKQTSLLKVLAKHTKHFCLEITESGIRLKQKHPYYKQVQGGMAITRKPGCDFVVYTYFMNCENIHIERTFKETFKELFFDPTFWHAPRKSFLTFISMLWFLSY